MNQLSVTGKINLERASESNIMFAGALISQEANQNPIDPAFLAATRQCHIFDVVPAVTAASLAPFDGKRCSQD